MKTLDLRRVANRAATLAERLSAFRRCPDQHDAELDGEAVVRAWRSAFAAPDDAGFRARLAWQDLTPDMARAAASHAVYATGPLPAWTTGLVHALEEARHVADDLDRGPLRDLSAAPAAGEPPFVELALPWLRAARCGLGSVPAVVEREAFAAMEARLLTEFGTYAAATVYQTYAANARRTDTPGPGAYDEFVRAMLRGGLERLFDEYPLLARHLSLVVDAWVQSAAELFARLAADLPAIRSTFCDGHATGTVVSIDPALSDPHDGRRRVVALTFSSGVRIVYKPRDLTVEHAFYGLLEWARDHGLTPAQRSLRVLARERYGWVAYASQAEEFSHADASRYYQQAGGLLCWAHLLRGRDLHMENVVASAGGPVLIDLEVLVQPVRSDETVFAAPSQPRAAPEPGAVSCLSTGLLSMLEVREDGDSTDVGGLRGTPASISAATVRTWRHLRTSAIEQTDEPAPPARVANGVMVEGKRARPEMYRDHVLEGFASTYRFVMAHRDILLADGGPLQTLSEGRVRILPRNTHHYAQVLRALNAPRYQGDGAVRGAWLDILARPFAGSEERPATWPLLQAEWEALERLDVPRFSVPTSGTTVFADDRAVPDTRFVLSGMTAVRQMVEQLSAADLAAQLRRLAPALTETVDTRFSIQIEPERRPGTAGPPDPAGALKATALVIGQELLERLSTAGSDSDQCDDITAVALYRGHMGPPVFFAALAAVTAERRWEQAARDAVRPVLRFLHRHHPNGRPWTLGVCDGVGAIVYSLTLVGRLLRDTSFVDEAWGAAGLATDTAIDADEQFDLTGGCAGAIMALTAMFRQTGDETVLARAERCASHLLAAEVRTPTGSLWPVAGGRYFLGLAHGSAGIGTAALSLAHATGRDDWRALGERAWGALAGSFQTGAANWPIEVSADGRPAGTAPPMTAWCHGSPGILIGLCRALDFGYESAILTHAAAAVTGLQQVSEHLEEHVCCGNLGRAEALLSAGPRFRAQAPPDAAAALGLRVVERAVRRQHVRLAATGFEYPVFRPGFFRGLSGVGYELLRLAAPATLPSVLGFE